jgi:surface polysaccharide O-acyltransferase-like enzyme
MENLINADFSKRITVLRFPLAVLVVFIHNYPSELAWKEIDIPAYVEIIRSTIRDFWGLLAVPTFFLISGYLFFAKPKPFNVIVKSKFRGIVVPYILWTVIAILIFFLLQSFSLSKPYFSSKPELIIENWNTTDYLSAFWAFGHNDSPFIGPFWYLRNLIILMIISPLIKILCK